VGSAASKTYRIWKERYRGRSARYIAIGVEVAQAGSFIQPSAAPQSIERERNNIEMRVVVVSGEPEAARPRC